MWNSEGQTSCLLSIAQLLAPGGCSTIVGIGSEEAYLHLIVVTSPQIDHDVFVAGVGGN
jgi:hypothetical protein